MKEVSTTLLTRRFGLDSLRSRPFKTVCEGLFGTNIPFLFRPGSLISITSMFFCVGKGGGEKEGLLGWVGGVERGKTYILQAWQVGIAAIGAVIRAYEGVKWCYWDWSQSGGHERHLDEYNLRRRQFSTVIYPDGCAKFRLSRSARASSLGNPLSPCFLHTGMLPKAQPWK